MISKERAANIIHLDADRLGDPYFSPEECSLIFRGEAARYVAETLNAELAERERRRLVHKYVALHGKLQKADTGPSMSMEGLLDEFSLALLGSSAVRGSYR